MYFLYILKLSNGEFYKGKTDNLIRRLKEHSNGRTQSIKKFLPFELVHVEIVNDLKAAVELERYFKSGVGREIIKQLFS